MNKQTVTYTINLYNLYESINIYKIEIELKKLFNIKFIGNDQNELTVSFDDLLTQEQEDLFFKKIREIKS
jgi:uncharacterized membrane protein